MPQGSLGELFRGLMRPVGNGRDNRQDDVLGVKHAMRSPRPLRRAATTA